MNEDFRALCAELADAYLRLLEHINNSTWLGYEPSDDPLLVRTRAALSAPEQGPTEAEVADLAENLEYQRLPQDTSTGPSFLLEFARAVLTRWGRPAVEPVPDAKRPWEREGWCDKEGMCWMGDAEGCGFVPSWRLCKPSDSCLAWSLPHWALPVPQEEADD